MTTPSRRLPRGSLYFDPAGALVDAMRSVAWGEGETVRRFEREFANALDAPEAVALPHARVALRELLAVLSLPVGSEVLMTPVTIPDIVSVVILAGLTPVFVDLAPFTCNIDCDDLARKITARSRLVLVTHLSGIPSEMERVMELAGRHGLEVLEDCSQVPATRHDGLALGLHGRAGFMSLTPLKPVSTLHGGMTVTRDPALARELRHRIAASPPPLPPKTLARLLARDTTLHLATHPAVFPRVTFHAVRALESLRPEVVTEFQRGNLFNDPARRRRVRRIERLPAWMDARFSDAQAAMGLRGLRSLARDNRLRRERALRLLGLLRDAGVPGLPRIVVDEAECTFWRFPLWVGAPSEVAPLRRKLLAHGVDTSPTNLECCSREEAFAPWSADTPEARRYVDAMIFLPMHSALREADVDHIARAVIDALHTQVSAAAGAVESTRR